MSLNEIANIASGQKVLSKARMWPIVVDVIRASVHTARHEDLADIYNFFMPTPGADPKTVEQWTAKALGKGDDLRKYLTYLYSDGKRLMATDGHRLHIVNKTDLAPGYYDRNLEKIDYDKASYPDVDRVIPDGQSVAATKASLLLGEIRLADESRKIEAIKVSNGTDDAWVNRIYLNQALSGFSDDGVRLLITGPDNAIRIDQGDRIAVIMPIRAKGGES